MSDRPKILVVDDNLINLEVLFEVLASDFEVALAEDGTAALTLAASFQPEVILLDVMMPGRDGFEVCRCFKQDFALRKARIIMVSAKAELSARLNGFAVGADDYVTKPFDEEELLTKVNFALRTKRLENLCGATGEVLALLSELRDTGCDPHMLSVRSIAHSIASELKLTSYGGQITPAFLDNLHHASVLRDVGMLSVPLAIREKTGLWTNEELEQVKQHTLTGAALLGRLATVHPDMALFGCAVEVARSHHERFDGRGYPDGLSGERIPLAARIVNVAEHLVHTVGVGLMTRSTTTAAMDHLNAGDGVIHDPVVIQALQRVVAALDEQPTTVDDTPISTPAASLSIA